MRGKRRVVYEFRKLRAHKARRLGRKVKHQIKYDNRGEDQQKNGMYVWSLIRRFLAVTRVEVHCLSCRSPGGGHAPHRSNMMRGPDNSW